MILKFELLEGSGRQLWFDGGLRVYVSTTTTMLVARETRTERRGKREDKSGTASHDDLMTSNGF